MNKNVDDFKIKRILLTLGMVSAYADMIKIKPWENQDGRNASLN